jgi:hypothetical protein
MKKLLLSLSAGVLLLAACSKDEPVLPPVLPPDEPATPVLRIEGEGDVTVDHTVAALELWVVSSEEPAVAPDVPWLRVRLLTAADSRYCYELALEENTTGQSRRGTIEFSHTGSTCTATFGLTQRHTPALVGMYLLSEGTMNNGNGQLAYFRYDKAGDTFVKEESMTFANYAETPNDLVLYGSKMYCAITGNSTEGSVVRVIDPETGATLRNIPMVEDGTLRQARRIATHGGNVYVSVYPNAVARIDTATFGVTYAGLSGTYPEGLAVDGQWLYVCNSGYGEDNRISVVNLSSFTESETIEGPYNPINIVAAGNSRLYVNTASVWTGPAAGAGANVHLLDAASKSLTRTFDVDAASIALGSEYLYGAGFSYTTYEDTFKKIALADGTVSDFPDADGLDELMGSYKLSVNPFNGEVFLSQGRQFLRFQANGTFVESIDAGAAYGVTAVFIIR